MAEKWGKKNNPKPNRELVIQTMQSVPLKMPTQKTNDGWGKHARATDPHWVPRDAVLKSFYMHRKTKQERHTLNVKNDKN